MEPEPRIILVENPRSRRGRASALEVRRYLDREGLAPRARWVSINELPGCPCFEEGPERVVAVGGDGTVNAVAARFLDDPRPGRSTPLVGIVPGGTGNNLAAGIGIPRQRGRAMAIALRGKKVLRIDAIRYRSLAADAGPEGDVPREGPVRWILQSAALGFPAEVAARYDALRRWSAFRVLAYPFGRFIYRILALHQVALVRWQERGGRGSGRSLQLEASLPGEELRLEALAIFLGNERSLGGDFHPCPRATPIDGKLDLCLVRSGPGGSYLRLFAAVARGAHLSLASRVEYRQSAGPITLRLGRGGAESREPLLADGDLWDRAGAFRFELVPGALPIAVGE